MIIYEVSAITRHIKDLLDSDASLQDLWVAGEVSNFTRSPSGHLYFTAKDGQAQMSCVVWRGQAATLPALPRNGERVIMHGYVSVYETRGAYQFYADVVQPEGIGVLAARFEELKQRLSAEGLFDAAHKRPLPRLPRRIGLVTSRRGAVLHDMVRILARRYPLAEVILSACSVQGAEAPAQIVAALDALQDHGRVDVIVVARGGGSLEDLWAFNEESVARAIYNCRVPVVSAIGHEVDFTIADFVADLRAPTPSAAAELVAPDRRELAAQVADYGRQLYTQMQGRLERGRSRLIAEERALLRLSPRTVITQKRQRVDDLWQRARVVMLHTVEMRRQQVSGLAQQIDALSPLATLDRGYAIVRRQPGGSVVSSVRSVHPGDALQVQVSDGQFEAVAGKGLRERRRQRPPDGEQMGLGL